MSRFCMSNVSQFQVFSDLPGAKRMSNVAFWLRIRWKCIRAVQLSTVQRATINGFETFDMRSREKVHVKRLTSHVKHLIRAHIKRLNVGNFEGLACQTSRLQAGAPWQKGRCCAAKECLDTEPVLSRYLLCPTQARAVNETFDMRSGVRAVEARREACASLVIQCAPDHHRMQTMLVSARLAR